MEKTEWIICPICRQKTRTKMREDTVMMNFPLFCLNVQNRINAVGELDRG